jgi:hypothetical protein
VVPVADEEKGKEAGQLPEEDQLDQVAGQYDSQHRAHESEQKSEEAWHRVGGRHVIAGIEDHQKADAGDQHGKQPGEAVHPQGEVQAEGRQPLDAQA